jgi:hypothetical protein
LGEEFFDGPLHLGHEGAILSSELQARWTDFAF